jgi:hypothetical protein
MHGDSGSRIQDLVPFRRAHTRTRCPVKEYHFVRCASMHFIFGLPMSVHAQWQLVWTIPSGRIFRLAQTAFMIATQSEKVAAKLRGPIA